MMSKSSGSAWSNGILIPVRNKSRPYEDKAGLTSFFRSLNTSNMSAPELVATSLREAITRGVLKGGEQLRQSDTARDFGVSVIPVREAFQQLIAEGFVKSYRNRGVVVAETTTSEIRELFDLRVALELVLLKNAIPKMTAETLSQAKAYQEKLESETDAMLWGKWNWHFHETLYLPANRQRTLKIVANVNAHVDRLLRVQMTLSAGAKATGRRIKSCPAGSPTNATIARKGI